MFVAVVTNLGAAPSAVAQIRNAAVTAEGRILTWGQHVDLWTNGKPRRVLSDVNFGEGGCLNRDHLFVLQRPGLGPLLRVNLTTGTREVIEPETDFADCLWTNLFGRPGLVIIHRYAQARFYQPPAQAGAPWTYQEVYSIYTASEQGGLLQADIDADGHDDFYLGNYWMKSPQALDLPWRIFAINLFHETPTAALARIQVYRGRDIVWAERTGSRVVWFERPTDVREQWTPHTLLLSVDQPNGLVIDNATILVGDRRGVYRWRAGQVDTLATGFPTQQLFLVDGELWAVTLNKVRRIRYRR